MRTPTTAPSTTTAHAGLLARLVTAAGLLSTLAYLGWRAAGSWHGATLAISVPLFALEIVGFLGAVLLAWALWNGRRLRMPPSTTANDELIDVVIRVRDEPIHQIVASVLSAQRLEWVGDVTVLMLDGASGRGDSSPTDSVRSLADELGVGFEMCPRGDFSGVGEAARVCRTASFLLIEAGDIVAAQALPILRRSLDDPSVAAVQAGSTTAADESLEHGPNGLHYDTFERSALNPALGGRHASILADSGILFRRGAIQSLGSIGTNADEPDWAIALMLMNQGWSIDAHIGPPLVAHQPMRDQWSVSERSAGRIRAARHLVFGADGALRSRRLRLAQRLSLLAWSVRPLSGARRIALVSIVLLSLIGGYTPMDAHVPVMVGLWLPGFCLTSLGLAVLSGWALRPGDRARWSLRHLNDTVRSLRDPGAPPTTMAMALRSGPLVATVSAITVTIVLRAISERFTDALGPLDDATINGLLMSALWTLGLALDSLNLLTRRSTKRRAVRRTAELPATLAVDGEDLEATVVDIGPLGAGIIASRPIPPNTALSVATVMSAGDMLVATTVHGAVRNYRRDRNGTWRIGVEFTSVDVDTLTTLVAATMLEPVGSHLGARPVSIPDTAPHEAAPHLPLRRRIGLRGSALIAVGASAATATATSSPGFDLGLVATSFGCVLAGTVVLGVRRRRVQAEPSVGLRVAVS
jgi:hypothetical protein